jgi:hypothetical protein
MLHGWSRRFLVAAVGLLATALGTATAAAGSATVSGVATAPAVPVRLLAPADGAVLTAGATASVEWTPLAHLARESDWEEWEAFLSLDGGATYPVRITPHLDRDLLRFTFKVPSLPTRNARLLLRVGDERREQAFELRQRFTITAPSGNAEDLALPRRSFKRGEPARPGERGVLAWVEGSRRGGQVREVVAADPARAEPGSSLLPDSPSPTAVAAPPPPSGAPGAEPVLRSTAPPAPGTATVRVNAPRPGAADLLLLIKRQNE